MAEYVLGRIKFVYQGAWTTGTGYVVDDVVTVGGKTYICVANHTGSGTFAADLSTKWKIVADGIAWRNTWTATTLYSPGDLVKFGAIVYICTVGHTSGSSTTGLDPSKFNIFANGTNYRSAWATSTFYAPGDLVTYGGYVYYCITTHTSAATAALGLEDGSANWQTFNGGLTYLGTWVTATRYKVNDLVKSGANVYICVLKHTSGGNIDTTGTYFQPFVSGLEFESSWSSSTAYQIGDLVTYGGYTYVAIQNGTNQNPSTANSYWTPITTGWTYQGDWLNSTSYKISQVVRLNGYTYLSLTDSPSVTATITGTTISGNLVTVSDTTGMAVNMTFVPASSVGGLVGGLVYYIKTIPTSGAGGTVTLSLTAGGTAVTITGTTTSQTISAVASAQPGNTNYWTRLNSGLYWTNPQQTYTTVTTSNVTVTNGAASGAQFTVVRSGTAYAVTRTANGTNYTTGDIIKIVGTAVGGLSPVNDITVTVTASAGAITAQTTTGVAVTWTSSTSYVLGDVATFGANSYICIAPHTSASANRPDADTTATYWNILSAGAEVATLTTAGDVLYYGPNGPTRLPVGTVGQVLRSTGTYPQWANWGQINNVVYVGPTGVDSPAPVYGATLDTPFSTVRYAAKQVEDGYLYPNAKYLLQVNKQFILKEVNNYVSYTYKASVTGTSATVFTTASTAGLYAGMPLRFSSLTGSLTIGGSAISTSTTYFVRDIVTNTSFGLSATVGGIAVTGGGTGTATVTYYYDPIRLERDAGLSLDGVIYDISHNGTAKTTANATAYYAASGTSYANGVNSYNITAFVGAQNYLSTLMGNVLANTAPASNYQTLNSVGTSAVQRINTSYTAEAGSTTIAQGLIGIITTGLLGGSTSSIPPATNPNTTISIKTGTYNEVLPIVVAANVAVVGDELRSTVVQPKSANALLVNDKAKTVAALTRIKTIMPTLMANSAVSATSGNTQTQNVSLPAGSIGSTASTSAVVTNATIIYNIIDLGAGSIPVYSLPSPTDYNTSLTNTAYATTGNTSGSTTGYGNAVAQIVQNTQFIKDELSAWLAAGGNGYSAIWTALGAGGQTTIQTKIGYLVDAIRYDMTYGGNSQSLLFGNTYYSSYTLAVSTNEKTATAAAYAWLKTFIDNISIANTAGWTKTTGSTQVITGSAGSANAGSFAQDRVQDVIDWINNGAANAAVSPATTWASSALQTAFGAIQARRSEIQLDSTAWVKKYYQSFNFADATCSRDVGVMLDAISYDLLTGSNVASSKAGEYYFRSTTSEQYSLINLKAASLGLINFIMYKAKQIAATGASAEAQNIINDIIATINATQIITGLNVQTYGTVSYNNTLDTVQGAEVLRANTEFLAYEATAHITASYGGMVTATTISGDLFTTSTNHNFVAGDPVVFSGATYTGSGVVVGTTYYVLATGLTGTAFSVSATAGGTAIDVTTNNSAGTTLFVRYSFDAVSCRSNMREWINALVYDLQYTGNYKSRRVAEIYLNSVNGSQTSDMFRVRNSTGVRNMTISGLYGSLGSPNAFGTRRPTAGSYVSLDPGFGPWDTEAWTTNKSCYVQNVTTFGYGCTGLKIDGGLHAGGNRSVVANDFTQVLSDGIGVWCTGANALTELVSVFSYYGYAGYLGELGGKIRATNGNSSYGTYGVVAEGVDTYETPLYARLNNRASQALITNTVTDASNQVLRFEYSNAGTNYTNTSYTINGSGFNAAAIGDEFRDAAVFETRVQDNNDLTGVGQIGGFNYTSVNNTAQAGAVGTITIAASDTALNTSYPGLQVQITAGTGVGQYGQVLSYNSGTKVATVAKTSFATLTVTGSTTTVLQVASTGSLYVGMPIYLSATTAAVFTANTVYYVATIPSTTTFTLAATAIITPITGLTATSSQTISLYAAGWDNVVPGKAVNNTLDLTSTYILEPRLTYSAPGYIATARTLSATATWKAVCFGGNQYVAVASGSTSSSYSANGTTWASAGALTGSTTAWQDVVFGGGFGAAATLAVGGLGGQGAVLTPVLTGGLVTSITVTNGGFGYVTAPTLVISGGGGSGATATCAVLNGVITGATVVINGSNYTSTPTVTIRTDIPTAITMSTWGNGYTSAPTVTVSDPFSGSAWSSAGASVAGNYYSHINAGVKNWYRATDAAGLGTVAPTFLSGTAGSNSNLAYAGTTTIGTPVLTNYGVSAITFSTVGAGYTATPTITILDSNTKYVAISGTSNATAYQTVAGAAAATAWTAGGTLPSSTWSGVAFGVYGGSPTWAAVGGTAAGAVTNDGVTWTTKALPTLGAGTYSAVAFGNGTFIAISTGNNVTAIYSSGTWIAGGTLPTNTTWTSITYGNGRFVAIAQYTRNAAYSIDGGATWVASPAGLPSAEAWTSVSYGQGLFVAVGGIPGYSTSICATSQDGINWALTTMPSSSSWSDMIFGNINGDPIWVAVSNASGTIAASIRTGATAIARAKVTGGSIAEVRMIEPGSGYPRSTVTSIAASNVINTGNTANLVDSQPIEFTGLDAYGLITNTTYYVIGANIVTNTSFKVSATAGSATAVTVTAATATGTYAAGPIVTITDPNKTKVAVVRVRTGIGALGQPSFSNRGTNNATATSSTTGDGFADFYQANNFIAISGLYGQPTAGANVTFASIPNTYFKLVQVINLLGTAGNYSATFQVNPALSVLNAPAHNDVITTRLKYSQVRLTGHDFLYIGTGNYVSTNYPNVDVSTAITANQQVAYGGGRVFFTSTDQDGNFNVGNLFSVQQATGTATLNATAFNLSGLQSLQLGSVTVGSGSATITQFSTDPYFTANSDNILPTQRAIKSYITSQIGGGQSSLNVNTLTSGVVYIAGNTISTTTGVGINVKAKLNFTGGIDGAPVAMQFFLQR